MERAFHWMQRQMLWLLLSTYVLGAFAPALGLRLREVAVFSVPGLGREGVLSLPMAMIGVLLLVAGLGARVEAIGTTIRRPALLLAGLTANTTYPLLFVAAMAVLLTRWHSADEAQTILFGLGLIGAMPIAGASTAWSQNTDGNLAMSLGLVWGSTLLSPLFSPLILDMAALVMKGEYSVDIRNLARHGASMFLVIAVVLPSLLGLAGQLLLGRARVARAMPSMKLLNLANLLVLSYANASASLPQAVRQPDPDFVALVLVVTTTMCAGAFGVGWYLPRRFHARRGDQTAMMFGLGMNNNGTGLVLAQAMVPEHPRVLLAIIFYNLVQQIGAGIVDRSRRREVPA